MENNPNAEAPLPDRAADSRLSTATRLMRTTLVTWPWNTTGGRQPR